MKIRESQDTFKYHLKIGAKVVHRGICTDLIRRQLEHQPTWSGSTIVQVGRRTTRSAALKWEQLAGKRSYTR